MKQTSKEIFPQTENAIFGIFPPSQFKESQKSMLEKLSLDSTLKKVQNNNENQ